MANFVPVTVTFVTQERDSVVIWCQRDTAIVRALSNHIERCIASNQCIIPQDRTTIVPNLFCYAVNADNKYYRARVEDVLPNAVRVRAIDYGFQFFTKWQDILLPPSDNPVNELPPKAEKFYWACIIVVAALTEEEIKLLEKFFLESEVFMNVESIHHATQTKFASFVDKRGMDVRQIWGKTGKFREVPLNIQDQLMNKSHQRPDAIQLPVQLMPPMMASPASPSPVLFTNLEVPKSLAGPPGLPGVETPRSFSPPAPTLLNIGSTYKMVVSDASEGPWSFSIQIENEKPILAKLMDEIQKVEKEKIRGPLYAGRHCIAYHRHQNVYARAMICNEGDRSALVAYIDFGGSEFINVNELFEVPVSCLMVQRLSQKFRLASMPSSKRDSDYYKEVSLIFQEVVRGRDLLLTVTKTEENCSQNCELYDSGTLNNIKEFINLRRKEKKILTYTSDSLPLAGTTLPVYVTFVESASSFYVQKREKEEDCAALEEALQDAGAAAVRLENPKITYPCLCKYSEDERWYRGRIDNFFQDKATVFFVDYGNTETLPINQLMELPRKLVKVPTFALRCKLDGNNFIPSISEKLNGLINADFVSAVVLSSMPEYSTLVVQIKHEGVDISLPNPVAVTNNFFSENTAAAGTEWDESSRSINSMLHRGPEPLCLPERNRSIQVGERGVVKITIKERFAGLRERLAESEGSSTSSDYKGSIKERTAETSGSFQKTAGSGRLQLNEDANMSDYVNPGNERSGAGGSRGWRNDRENNDNAGNSSWQREGRKFRDEGGFQRKEVDGTGFSKFEGGGFEKQADRDSFRKFGDRDGGGRPNRPMRTPIRYQDRAPAGSDWQAQEITLGESQQVFVSHYTSPCDFYVHPSIEPDSFVSLVKEIQLDYANKFSFKRNEPPQVSDIVIAKYYDDRVLYRAVVIEAEPLTVQFVDYGNSEIVADSRDVYPVLAKLVDFPKQAVRCRLAGVRSPEDDWSSMVKEYFDKDEYTCTFLEEVDGFYYVNLTSDGEDIAQKLVADGLAVIEDKPSTIEEVSAVKKKDIMMISPKLLEDQVTIVKFTFIGGVEGFYFQPDSASVRAMEEMVAEFFETAPEISTKPHVGQLCVASSSGRSQYRARILSCSEHEATVQFIDYGDLGVIPLENLREISEELESYPPLAVACYLEGDLTKIPDHAKDLFETKYTGENLIVHFHSDSDIGRLSCTIYEMNGEKVVIEGWEDGYPEKAPAPSLVLPGIEMTVDIIEISRGRCLITVGETSLPSREVRSSWPMLGEQRVKVSREENEYRIEPVDKMVLVSFVVDNTTIYVNPASVRDKMFEINEAIASLEPVDHDGSEIFAAKFPDDETWYRARSVDPSTPLSVQFIDYGNCCDVTEVAPLPEPLCQIPALALPFELSDIPESAIDDLNLLPSSETPLRLVEENGKVIDLFEGKSNVLEKILKRRLLSPGKTVFITHVESVDHFYVQRSEDTEEIEDINTKLFNANTFQALSPPFDGKLVAAKFNEDWYRARVEGQQVWFADFGNYAEQSEVLELPADLLEVLPLAIRVALHPPDGHVWSSSAKDILLEFLNNTPLVVIEAVWVGDSYIVKLAEEGQDITNMLGTELAATQDTVEEPAAETSEQELLDATPSVQEIVNGDTAQFSTIEDVDVGEAAGFDHQWPDASTDDFKSDTLGREINETDEEKREKFQESPRCDDEKSIPANVPDCELANGIVSDATVTVERLSLEERETQSPSSDLTEYMQLGSSREITNEENDAREISVEEQISPVDVAEAVPDEQSEVGDHNGTQENGCIDADSQIIVEGEKVSEELVEIPGEPNSCELKDLTKPSETSEATAVEESTIQTHEVSSVAYVANGYSVLQQSRPKTPVVDKIVPGSISRGINLS